MHSNNSVRTISLNYTIALIPLILYGFYKNGILVYLNSNGDFFTLFKPLVFILIALVISGLFDKYYFKVNSSDSLTTLFSVISSMIIPISSNVLIYGSLLSLFLIFSKYLKQVNYILLVKLGIVVSLLMLSEYTYLNSWQLSNEFNYSFFDILIGNSNGGVAATSSIFVILGYIYLINTSIYKKEIPIFILGSYIIVSLGCLVLLDFEVILNNFFNSTILFGSVFIATLPMFSPIGKRRVLIYSVLTGVLSALVVNFISIYEGFYIVLFVVSLIFLIKIKKR